MTDAGEHWLEIASAFPGVEIHGPRDASYALPTEPWLREQFGPFLTHEFWAYSRNYIREKFDCDDFADEAEIEATLAELAEYVIGMVRGLRAKMSVKAAVRSLVANPELQGCGVAFHYCEITLREGRSLNGVPGPGRHATNLVRTPTGWFFFEPQNSQLTPANEALHPDSGSCQLVFVLV
jgi:hypothetical protein